VDLSVHNQRVETSFSCYMCVTAALQACQILTLYAASLLESILHRCMPLANLAFVVICMLIIFVD